MIVSRTYEAIANLLTLLVYSMLVHISVPLERIGFKSSWRRARRDVALSLTYPRGGIVSFEVKSSLVAYL